jgi:hypothetical protein
MVFKAVSLVGDLENRLQKHHFNIIIYKKYLARTLRLYASCHMIRWQQSDVWILKESLTRDSVSSFIHCLCGNCVGLDLVRTHWWVLGASAAISLNCEGTVNTGNSQHKHSSHC